MVFHAFGIERLAEAGLGVINRSSAVERFFQNGKYMACSIGSSPVNTIFIFFSLRVRTVFN